MELDKVEVYSFLSSLGIRNLIEDGEEIKYSCPFSGHKNGDANPSASMQQGTTVAHCFGCGWSGNAVTFLSELEGVPPLKALQWIREEYGDGWKDPDETLSKEINEILSRDPERGLEEHKDIVLDESEVERRLVDWDKEEDDNYLLRRGFSRKILKEFQIGWDTISQRYTIPIRDGFGNLVGFKGRCLPGIQPRYLVLGGSEYGFDTYNISTVLFGLWNIKLDSFIILTEGELNLISLRDKGFLSSVGISGKFLSNAQVNQLVKLTNKVVIIFDEKEDALRAARKLEPYISVRIFPDHKEDPAEMSEEEISSLLVNSVSSLLL